MFCWQITKGIGSSHTGPNKVWHMSLIMKGMVSTSSAEKRQLLEECLETDANTGKNNNVEGKIDSNSALAISSNFLLSQSC